MAHKLTLLLILCLYSSSLCYVFQPPLSTGVVLWDIYTTDTASLDILAKNWQIYNLAVEPSTRMAYCYPYTYKFFGGVGLFPSGGYLERVYSQIQPHDIIYYVIEVAIYGNWQPNNYVSVQFGDSTPKIWNFASALTAHGISATCDGQSTRAILTYIVGRVFHTGDTLRITIQYDFDTPGLGFGFRDLVLGFRGRTADDVEDHYIALGDTTIPDSNLCGVSQYFDTSSQTCKNCQTGCVTCFGPSTSQCYRCAWGYSLVGTSCVQCPSSCGHCSGPSSGQCVICSSSSTLLDWDKVCKPSCTSPPTTQIGMGDVQVCVSSCATNQYMIWNNTCVDSCTSPLFQTTQTGITFCNSPCNQAANEYYYWNGSCLTTCAGYYERTQEGYSFCDACQPGYFRYENGSCLPTCETFFNQITVGGSHFCYFPCDTSEFLLWDGTCVPDCMLPAIAASTTVGNMCLNPCPDTTYYLYQEEGICKSSCDDPYEASAMSFVKVCLVTDEVQTIKQVATITSIMACITVAFGLVNSILSENFELVFIMFMTKMLEYIKYLQINYPTKVQIMLDNQLSISGVFNFPPLPSHAVEDWFPNYPLPGKLGNGDFHSAFVTNYFDDLMFILALVFLIFLFWILERYMNKGSRFQNLVNRVIVTFKWNFFVIAFSANYGDMTLYTCLQSLTLNSDFRTALSMTICLVMNCVGLYILIKIILVNRALKAFIDGIPENDHREFLEKFKEKWKHFATCFSDYKIRTFSQQIFALVLLIRIILFNIIIGALFDKPLVQASLLVTLSILMSMYLIIKTPMNSKLDQMERVVCELIVLTYNVCVLSLAILDRLGKESVSIRSVIGNVMVYIVVIINSLYLLFESINAALLVRKLIYAYRRKKLERKVVPLKISSKISSEIQSLFQKPTHQAVQPIESNIFSQKEAQSSKNQLDIKGRSMIALFGSVQFSPKTEQPNETSIMINSSPPSSQSRILFLRPQSRKSTFLEDQEQRKLKSSSVLNLQQAKETETIMSQIEE